jgi:hypothetical protein
MNTQVQTWHGELVVERIEDEKAHIELIDNGSVSKMVTIDADLMSDDHFHDGMRVAVQDGQLVPLYRESAERERYIKQKVERMGQRLDDDN